MPLRFDPRAHTGFSEDGSYSVADDYSKLAGQAMAEYEARVKNPRYNPFGSSPDAPDVLRRELFDPLALAFGGPVASVAAERSTPRSESRNIGGNLLERDPHSGAWSTVFSTPAKVDNRLADFKAKNLAAEASALNALRQDPLKMSMAKMTPETISQRLGAIDQEVSDLLTPQTQPAAASAPAPTPLMSIGERNAPLVPIIRPGERGSGVAPRATRAKEVERVTGDGRTAIFDAETKEFIRYAQ